ncbi:FAD:protein FMN transferase [Candidatus Sulfurimonas marisnigri]|uniref:FAD:protein FMN transferase n=2 Tax=Candidatus Sulfurimonas marisnigri TaxID=2740405 RepID=A0A7S7M2D7_9BACT|nr:FAD:protein FMN transferase [Candidatus Sulfurimonas marisnigri]
MSTFVTVSVEEENKNYIEDAFNIIKDVDNSISSYNPNSIIYQLNKNLFKIGLDKYSYEALTLSQRYYKRTDGYFDITIGSVTKKLYKFGEEQRVPTSKELSGAIVKIQGLHVEKEKACMEYGMQVDLGGMGKGFAVDKVAEYFRNKDVVNATIRASGDIRCLSTCMLHVQDPFSEGHLLSFETSKNDLGITTSGNYNRYVGTTKNNHLINPKLKAPQTKFISITLIGSMPSADLDAYATAASVMPTKKGYEFLNSLGVGYIVMQCDKKIIISENISKFTKNLLVNNAVKN